MFGVVECHNRTFRHDIWVCSPNMVLMTMCPQRATMVDSAWAWSAKIKGPVCGLLGLVRHPRVDLWFLSRKKIQRNKSYITNKFRYPGPSRSL